MVEHSAHPLVDIVIPVHSTSRPLARAVASAWLAARGAAPGQCRVTVVAHHLTGDQVREMLPPEHRAAVHVLECEDRGTTAAVPRNEALRRTTARYVSFLDSDDTLDPGAVTRWIGIAEHRGSDLVMPFQHHENDRVDITPITRPFRSARLDPVRDRLAYRSTAFGLVRVSAVRAFGIEFDESVVTGEDQSFVMRLYSVAGRIDYAVGGPGLQMGADATDRVSREARTVREVLAAPLKLGKQTWFTDESQSFRTACILKYIRVNFFPAVEEMARSGSWDSTCAQDAAAAFSQLLEVAGRGKEQLSRADCRAARLLARGAEQNELLGALEARRRFATPAALLTEDPRWVLARQAPLRIAAASAAQMVRYRLALAARRPRL
ncbi:glycosyltransferase [Glutamicibacter protophormiae]|nr:glycosyltransferase [Glutamicibacter protophormiae]